MMKTLKPDPFVLCLVGAIFLAYLTPGIGSAEGPFSLHRIANYGVIIIFFCYGIRMSLSDLWKGLTNWKLHIAVHASSFLIFPLVTLLAYLLLKTESTRLLWIWIFFTAVLPSTVSSGVVLVSMARGNVPAAIFDASVSSILGIFLTPLWMSLLLATGQSEFNLLESIGKLVLIFLLPIGLGMCLNPKLGDWMGRNRKYLRYFDQSVVLLIVYTTFCDSFMERIFDGFSLSTLLILGAGLMLLFFIVYGIIKLLCRMMRFNREDTITVLFCGSKKSLMHGTAMGNVIFAGLPGLGVILLPIMIYHALQLIVVSVIAKRYANDPL